MDAKASYGKRVGVPANLGAPVARIGCHREALWSAIWGRPALLMFSTYWRDRVTKSLIVIQGRLQLHSLWLLKQGDDFQGQARPHEQTLSWKEPRTDEGVPLKNR